MNLTPFKFSVESGILTGYEKNHIEQNISDHNQTAKTINDITWYLTVVDIHSYTTKDEILRDGQKQFDKCFRHLL